MRFGFPKRVRLASAAFALAGLLASGVSLAGPQEDAVGLVDEGVALAEKGAHGRAAAKFEEAIRLYYSPVFALHWANAVAAQGKLLEARSIVRRIAKEPVDDEKPSWGRAVADAKRLGESLNARIPTVIVEVVGVEDAKVTVDGEVVIVGEAIQKNPGAHEVTAISGEEKASHKFTLEEGEAHKAQLMFGGGVAAPELSMSLVGPLIGYSLAGVNLVVGTVTGLIFVGKVDELEQRCPDKACPPDQQDLLSETDTLGNVSTAAFVIAGLAAAAGTALLFLPIGEGDPAVVVKAGPGAVAVSVSF